MLLKAFQDDLNKFLNELTGSINFKYHIKHECFNSFGYFAWVRMLQDGRFAVIVYQNAKDCNYVGSKYE